VTPLAITVLCASFALTAALAGSALIASALWWQVKKIEPIGQLRGKIYELEAMVDGLEAQVNKLRTRKAAAASPRTKEKQAPEADEYDDLAGLSPADRALFRYGSSLPEEVENYDVPNGAGRQ